MTKKDQVGYIRGWFSRVTAALICATLISAMLILCTVGCDDVRKTPTELFSGAIDAELTVDTGELVYCVTVHLGAVTDGVRDAEVIFLSPESLAGMTARENADGRMVSLGEMTVGGDDLGGLFVAASLFAPAEVVDIDTETVSGVLRTSYLLSDGRRVYADVETGTVVRIVSDGCNADVAWIETAGWE